jgi:phosphoglycolate phosphatase
LDYILMDLDGTLVNSKTGITKAVQYALKFWNITIEDLDILTPFIGPPLTDSFMKYYGFGTKEAEKAVSKYREYYSVYGVFQNEVYAGMEEFLAKIGKAGKKFIVATSKPEVFARKILKELALEDYFLDICGSTLDQSRKGKADVIRYALNKNKITDKNNVVMIGDREYDVIGAKSVGIACIGVLYGFGTCEELKKAGADGVAATLEELYDMLNE